MVGLSLPVLLVLDSERALLATLLILLMELVLSTLDSELTLPFLSIICDIAPNDVVGIEEGGNTGSMVSKLKSKEMTEASLQAEQDSLLLLMPLMSLSWQGRMWPVLVVWERMQGEWMKRWDPQWPQGVW